MANPGKVAPEDWHGLPRASKAVVALVAEIELVVNRVQTGNGPMPDKRRIEAPPGRIDEADLPVYTQSTFEFATSAYAVLHERFAAAYVKKSRRKLPWKVEDITVQSWHHLPIVLWCAALGLIYWGPDMKQPRFHDQDFDEDLPAWARALAHVAAPFLPRLRREIEAELREATRPPRQGLAALTMAQKATQAAIMLRDGATITNVCKRFGVTRQVVNCSPAWEKFRVERDKLKMVRRGGSRKLSLDKSRERGFDPEVFDPEFVEK